MYLRHAAVTGKTRCRNCAAKIRRSFPPSPRQEGNIQNHLPSLAPSLDSSSALGSGALASFLSLEVLLPSLCKNQCHGAG